MAEVAQHNNIKKEKYIPLSPEERQKAKPVATEIWKICNKNIIDGHSQLIPGDMNYAEIRLYGPEDMKAVDEREDDLVIELVLANYDLKAKSSDSLSLESFHFFVVDGGPVIKETFYSNPKRVERHEANKAELEKLLRIIKNSRGVKEAMVPSR
jgi:hypothetical protein